MNNSALSSDLNTHELVNQLASRVMARCDRLATCSEESERLTRRFLTPPMCEVHDLVDEWMRQAGLETRVDHAGNIVGRRPAALSNRTLLVGSHLDTVPGAGRYDGVLGVLIGIAVCEALGQRTLPFHLDVVGFSEEEGVRFSKTYLGSSAIAGLFDEAWLGRTDQDGISMRDAIAAFGLDPSQIHTAAYATGEVLGFVEPHLEQGPVLELANLPVGVVSGISGQSRLRLEFRGQAGHAGTTPMSGRCDALVMAANFVTTVNRAGRQTDGLRATVGCFEVAPNAPNVIPSRVELSLDVRHRDDPIRQQAISELLSAATQTARADGGEFAVLEQTSQQAVAVDAPLCDQLAAAITHSGHQPLRLESGAGHDAVIMAQRFPTAMLFVRHPGGVSHHPDERVDVADVAVAIKVLIQFILDKSEQPVS